MTYLAIFIGGGLGSMLRFYFSKSITTTTFPHLIWGTFAANMLSCLVLGFVLALAQKNGMQRNILLFTTVGFCGGFSTFSTFSLELFRYLEKGEYLSSIIYLMASILLGLGCVILGMKLGS